MNFATRIGFLAALLILIGVAFAGRDALVILGVIAPIVMLFGGLWLAGKHTLHPQRGAVTITYQYPDAGIVAPLPANFPNGYNTVRGTVAATADADTTAAVVHNFGLSAGALAAGQPEVQLIPLKTQFYTSVWIAVYTDGNTVTLTKGTGGGSGVAGGQLGFAMRRPHSIAI